MISWVSPERGLRRQAARARIALVSQSYDGARHGRRTDGWVAQGTSGSSEALAGGPLLMNRSRDLARNNPNIVSAKRAVRNYAVGTGIELQWDNPRWQALWDDWIGEADASGQLDFYGVQSLAAGAIFESGSVLLRRRARREEDGLVVPVQVEALEPDHLDRSRDIATSSGGYIMGGIEFDALSRRHGYWIFPVHPGESGSAHWRKGVTLESKFVPANLISHAYQMDRPGQVTGVPWTHSVILKARDASDYDEAELVRKKIEACNVGAVTQAGGLMGNALGPTAPGAPSGTGAGQAGGDPRPEQFEPGTFFYFGPGETVEFNDPKGNTAYSEYMKTHQRAIGAGTSVPYDKITGDLSDANFSSLKAGSNQFEANMDVFRWITIIPGICEPARRWFVEAAQLSGKAPARLSDFEWQPPPYPEVDPLKEASARKSDVRAGVKTMFEVIRSRGGDPNKQLKQIAEWNKTLDELGIVLDTDPRKVTGSGVGHSVDPTGDEGDEE